MKKIFCLFFALFLLTAGIARAAEVLADFSNKSLPVLNEELRKKNQQIKDLQARVTTLEADVTSLDARVTALGG